MQAVSTDHQEGKNARTVVSTAQGGRRHRRQTGWVRIPAIVIGQSGRSWSPVPVIVIA